MSWSYESFIADFDKSALGLMADVEPWNLCQNAGKLVDRLIAEWGSANLNGERLWIDPDAKIEDGAIVKAPAFIGPGCFVASGAYLRGGCWLERDVTIGPACELKSSFVFSGTKLAHFNFVGDSILGRNVNLEAGAIIANFRNENGGEPIRIVRDGARLQTGVRKFGALVGDGSKIGANAVVAPGALIAMHTIVDRLALIDQSA